MYTEVKEGHPASYGASCTKERSQQRAAPPLKKKKLEEHTSPFPMGVPFIYHSLLPTHPQGNLLFLFFLSASNFHHPLSRLPLPAASPSFLLQNPKRKFFFWARQPFSLFSFPLKRVPKRAREIVSFCVFLNFGRFFFLLLSLIDSGHTKSQKGGSEFFFLPLFEYLCVSLFLKKKKESATSKNQIFSPVPSPIGDALNCIFVTADVPK